MPSFINNKGNDVVPSLLTLAAVADGITEENMQDIPVQLRKETIALRQRLGVDTFRIPGESPVYIASDIKSSPLVTCSTKMDFFRRENKLFQSIYNDDETSSEKRFLKELSRIKKFLASTRRVSTTIRTVNSGWYFEYYRSHEDAAVIIVEARNIVECLFEDGVDMTTVKKFIMGVGNILSLLQYFNWFPNLTSLDLVVFGNFDDWKNVVLFKDKLIELKLRFWNLNYDEPLEFSILRQLHLLQHLTVFHYCNDWDQAVVNMLEDLVTLPNLRSLTLMGAYNITPDDVITFLVAEVEHHGQMVERQLLMTDLTLLYLRDFNFDEIYESEALTQEMKDRIYCSQDSNHTAAALALLVKRDDREEIGGMISHSYLGRDTPHPLLLKMVFERIKLETPSEVRLPGPWYDLDLLHTDEQVQRYSPELLSAASAHFARKLKQRVIHRDQYFIEKGFQKEYFPNIVEVVRILDRHVETPPDIPSYLTMLVTIMDYSWKKFDVANLFLRQAKKLPPIELANFIDNHKKQLTCVAMQFLFAYHGTGSFTEPRVPMTTTISTKMAEMFTRIDKYTTDFDLKIAIDALLKAANSAAPPSNVQGVNSAAPPSNVQGVNSAAPPSNVQGVNSAAPPSSVQGVNSAAPPSSVQGVNSAAPPSNVQGVNSAVPPSNVQGVNSVAPPSNVQGVNSAAPPSNVQGVNSAVPPSNVQGVNSAVPPSNVQGVNSAVPPSNVQDVNSVAPPSNVQGVNSAAPPSSVQGVNSAAPPSNVQGVSFAERRRQEEVHRVAAPFLVPGRLYNHLYWKEGHCIKDTLLENQSH